MFSVTIVREARVGKEIKERIKTFDFRRIDGFALIAALPLHICLQISAQYKSKQLITNKEPQVGVQTLMFVTPLKDTLLSIDVFWS